MSNADSLSLAHLRHFTVDVFDMWSDLNMLQNGWRGGFAYPNALLQSYLRDTHWPLVNLEHELLRPLTHIASEEVLLRMVRARPNSSCQFLIAFFYRVPCGHGLSPK